MSKNINMQSIPNVGQLKEEFSKNGVVTFPFLKEDNANEYVDHLINGVPLSDWILSASKNIEMSPKNINLVVNEWNNTKLPSKYFYLPTDYKDPKVFNLFKKSLVIKHINKVIPEVTEICDTIAVLLTSGCYVGKQSNDKMRFIWHLSKDWKGKLSVNNCNVNPKFSYITILKPGSEHSISKIEDNLDIPQICITGFLN